MNSAPASAAMQRGEDLPGSSRWPPAGRREWETMSIRTLQAYALILSGITTLVWLVGPDTPLFNAILIISTILFIIGIPAAYTSQPLGTPGLVGIILVVLAAVIALGFQSLDLNLSPALEGLLFWTSVIAGTVGRLIVGWLTTRRGVFPAWVGVAFMIEGLLFIGGSFDLGSFANVYNTLVILVGVAAVLGYGFYLLRAPRAAAALS